MLWHERVRYVRVLVPGQRCGEVGYVQPCGLQSVKRSASTNALDSEKLKPSRTKVLAFSSIDKSNTSDPYGGIDARTAGESIPRSRIGQSTKSGLYLRVFFGKRISSTSRVTACPVDNGAKSRCTTSG